MSENKSPYNIISGENKNEAIQSHQTSLDTFNSVQKNVVGTHIGEVLDDIHIREGFNQGDFSRGRPSHKLPQKFPDKVEACRAIYTYTNIVRNTLDLMSDFACEDLQIVHPDPKHNALLNVWAQKADIWNVANEWVKHFLVDGNVVLKRGTAKLTKPVENEWRREVGKHDEKLKTNKGKPDKREIPWRYNFLNVTSLGWKHGEVGRMIGERQLLFKPSRSFMRSLAQAIQKDPSIKQKLPKDIANHLDSSSATPAFELDMNKIYIAHHKKNSWDDWADPFLISILPDVHFKDKLRMAENSALDGVINVIRLWKLGDHQEGILPNETAIEKLIDILNSNTGGGAMDIVWDSLISMEDFYPPIDQILGSEKYEQVNRDILVGLGVPEVLIGGSGSNFSNAWIQLKTLVEKLEYIRTQLLAWLKHEIQMFCHAMGIETMPKVKFGHMNLQDENVTKRLILGLWDRGIVSTEAVLNAYGEDFELEMERRVSNQKTMEDKGIDTISPLERNEDHAGTDKGDPGGRPPDTKDVDRKERNPKPQSGSKVLYALDAIDAIDRYVIPRYIDHLGVKNARQLTQKQKEEVDTARRCVLSCINFNDSLEEESVLEAAEKSEYPNRKLVSNMKNAVKKFVEERRSEPTLSQKKRIEAVVWANSKENT